MLDRPSGAQSGLVPTDACHVSGEQRRRRGAEWNPEPAGEVGVDHEAGGQPVWAAEWAEGAGAYSLRFRFGSISTESCHLCTPGSCGWLHQWFAFLCADDGAEEAEAADRSPWAPPPHEHQPTATSLKGLCSKGWGWGGVRGEGGCHNSACTLPAASSASVFSM